MPSVSGSSSGFGCNAVFGSASGSILLVFVCEVFHVEVCLFI